MPSEIKTRFGTYALTPEEEKLLWESAHQPVHLLLKQSSWMKWIISQVLLRVGVTLSNASLNRVLGGLPESMLPIIREVEPDNLEIKQNSNSFLKSDVQNVFNARIKKMDFLDEMKIKSNLSQALRFVGDPSKQGALVTLLETTDTLAKQYLQSHPCNAYVKGPLSNFIRRALALTSEHELRPM